MNRAWGSAVLLLVLAACGDDGGVASDRPGTFNCPISSMNNTVLVDAQGAPRPQEAAAEYIPSEYDAAEPEPTGSDGAMVVDAYDGEDLVVRVEVAELRSGGGWWAISVDQCTDR